MLLVLEVRESPEAIDSHEWKSEENRHRKRQCRTWWLCYSLLFIELLLKLRASIIPR
jgi:hypothetical protein